MRCLFLVLYRSRFAALVLALVAFAPSAPSSAGSGPASNRGFLPDAGGGPAMRAARGAASASPTPIPFVFQTVDDPSSTSNTNRDTGINQLGKITGVYGSGCMGEPYTSFTSEWPYTKFAGDNDPNAAATYLTSLTSDKAEAGFVCSPGGMVGTWGVIHYQGDWILIPRNPQEGTGANAVMELLGINDSLTAVGFYLDKGGAPHPFAVTYPSESVSYFDPPSAGSAEAAGINGKGDVTGVETTTSRTIEGWFYKDGSYNAFSIPGSTSTTPYGINWQDQVVGSYTDSSGKTHGFLLNNPGAKGSQNLNWQAVNEPKNLGITVVSDISNHDCITGWYKGAGGKLHGFVAMPSASSTCGS